MLPGLKKPTGNGKSNGAQIQHGSMAGGKKASEKPAGLKPIRTVTMASEQTPALPGHSAGKFPVAMPKFEILKKPKTARKARQAVEALDPGPADVFERDLVKEAFKVSDILKHHRSYCNTKTRESRFGGTVLGYVTPWNNRGYDIAKIFGSKFNYVSPVWLQLELSQEKSGFAVAGQHDVDVGWIQDVKTAGKTVKLVPRVLFERWTPQQLSKVASSKKKMTSMASVLIEVARKSGFDGYVLELWSQFGAQLAT
ncbi:hypothetical protein V5799_017195, partial [Amblyomma americanum]